MNAWEGPCGPLAGVLTQKQDIIAVIKSNTEKTAVTTKKNNSLS